MITLYHAPNSRSVRVYATLEELDLQYEVKQLTFPVDLRSDAYLKINPLARVPALTDGEVSLFESGAIVQYLLARYGNGRLEPAVESPDFPIYLQWFHCAEATFLPPLSDLIQHTMVLPEDERVPGVIPWSQKRIRANLDVLETAVSGGEFLAGRAFSAADIMMAYTLHLVKLVQLFDSEDHPNTGIWLDKVESRPAWKVAVGL
jgi:glutathione S-transferase